MDRRDLPTTRERPPRGGAGESRCAGEAAAVGVPPPYVLDDADRERWELCRGIAERITGAPAESEDGWMLVRWLYCSELPTHEVATVSGA